MQQPDRYDEIVSELTSMKYEVNEIKERNRIKDIGKDFEASYTRMIFIMVLTYCTLFGYMTLIDTPNPSWNALVPTIGFNLSTWSLPYVKDIWIYFKYPHIHDQDSSHEYNYKLNNQLQSLQDTSIDNDDIEASHNNK